MKSKGPSTDPCGTPASIFLVVDVVSSILTLNVRLVRYDSVMFVIAGGIPLTFILQRSPSCHTLSKAFSISRKIAPVGVEVLKLSLMSSVIWCSCWMVECCSRNPN